jgi:H+/gluconate symporter-like permease
VQCLKLPTACRGTPMKKLIVLEALALAAGIVTLTAVNPQTGQMMVAASQAANRPQESVMGKIIAFVQAAGTVAMLTVNPRSAKPQP